MLYDDRNFNIVTTTGTQPPVKPEGERVTGERLGELYNMVGELSMLKDTCDPYEDLRLCLKELLELRSTRSALVEEKAKYRKVLRQIGARAALNENHKTDFVYLTVRAVLKE